MRDALQLTVPSDVLQTRDLHNVPKLLVEWSSPWREFVSAIRPALARSAGQLAGEARTGLFPYRGMLTTWALEALLLLAVIVLPRKVPIMQPYTPLPRPKYDVLYFSGDELPRTEDVGGARTGRSGRAGGHEGYHRTQTIRVARGDSLTEKVVDAPKLNLPKSDSPVANLLAIQGVPGPPPASGLRSSLPALPQVAPVAPPPEVSRDKIPTTPGLSAAIVPPPPDVSRDKIQAASGFNSAIVPPPPDVSRDKVHAVQGLSTPVIPPAPTVQRDVAGSRVPDAPTSPVIPPPVSAPVNTTSVANRLSLPQPSVIAPPPSNVTREITTMSGAQVTDIQKQIVPPPVQVGGQVSGRQTPRDPFLATNVVPPPPTLSGETSLAGASGRQTLGNPGTGANVVPPPPTVSGGMTGTSGGRTAAGLAGSPSVVPPPPTVSGGTSLTGRGRGNAGSGLGGSMDLGSVAAPPAGGGGSGNKAGVVASGQPGTRLGVPNSGGKGSMAVSPAGGTKTGLGGSGGGTGIGRGNGSGSGLEGEGTGAGKTGTGLGSDPSAKSGISPYPGPGGAGNASSGNPAAPGVSVSGGNSITLPSFGTSGDAPSDPGRSTAGGGRRGPGITVVATSRSGGVFNFYGKLPGDNYSIYIPTSLGMAVMQFADPASAAHHYPGDLSPPDALRTTLPAGLGHSRVVIACILDRSGVLKDLRVLESGSADMSAKILAALPTWKFRPALRGTEPVEVNAILGFNIDTN